MKSACCDTSFLYALYSQDIHSPRAFQVVRSLNQPVTLSLLNIYEFEHALRFAVWRRLIPETQANSCLSNFKSDVATGRMLVAACALTEVIAKAQQLSTAHTINGGHRAFDIFHVAAAVQLKAGDFLSFDNNQRKLAAKAGLQVKP